MTTRTIGWIGFGRIGLPMAERAAQAGFALKRWTRRPEIARGGSPPGTWVASPEDLAPGCDIIVTVLGTSADVLEVQRRVLTHAAPGTIFVDMTTAAPSVARALDVECAQRGVERLDAPVTGGVASARDGRLAILVGGSATTLARARSLLEALGDHVVHCGDAGSGYRMKLVNQIAMTGALLGLVEAAAFAEAGAFDAALVTDALGTGTASGPLFRAYLPRLMPPGGPVTFTLGMLRKDLELARDEAILLGCDERWLDFAIAEVESACTRFGADEGVQRLAQRHAASVGDPARR